MAMLAEPKTKQKWSNDPRNTTWTNDTNRFGYQMLSKMGWESGKGLGAKEDGTTTHVKSVKRRDNLGLGADKSNGDNWLSHQLAFDDLLSKLNDNGENGSEEDKPKKKKKKHEMEKTARQSRKRVFYNRFIQSKDLSSKSAKDMACIFGQRSKSAPGTPQEQSEGEDSDTSTASCPPPAPHGVQTINSGQSIQEYFENKMKNMKAARAGKMAGEEIANKEQACADGVQENVFSYPEIAEEGAKLKKKKKEKGRKRKTATDDVELGSNESGLQFGKDECSEKKKKKNAEEGMKLDEESEGEVQEARSEEQKNKKRKERKFKVTDSEICEGDEVQSEFKECSTTEGTKAKAGKKKDKRNKKKDKNTTPVELEMSSDRKERKDKKNKVKKPRDPGEEETCEISVVEVEERKNDKGKKRKRKEKCYVSHDSGSVEITVKKKKKKDKSKDSEKKRQQ